VGEFGDKFRKAREKKGISLEDVSNVTKISARNLQAIEEEHFDQLPGGVFNKGFIRAYAKHVGLDGEQAVNEYLACLRQAQIDAQAVWAPEERAREAEKRPLVAAPRAVDTKAGADPASKNDDPVQVQEPPELQLLRAEDVGPPRREFRQREGRISWSHAAVAVLILILGLVLWQRHLRVGRVEGAAGLPPATASTPPVPSAEIPGSAAPVLATAKAAQEAPPSPAPMAAQPAAQATKSASLLTTPAKSAAPAQADDAGDPAPQVSKMAAPAEPAPRLTLVIRANENSWAAVTADGQLVTQETLIAPAHTSVHATREIVAKVGNAAGVTFLWNGEEIPAGGGESEVKTFVFDASGMKVLPSVPAPALSH
jgi:cytoskeletal protein RodZ